MNIYFFLTREEDSSGKVVFKDWLYYALVLLLENSCCFMKKIYLDIFHLHSYNGKKQIKRENCMSLLKRRKGYPRTLHLSSDHVKTLFSVGINRVTLNLLWAWASDSAHFINKDKWRSRNCSTASTISSLSTLNTIIHCW